MKMILSSLFLLSFLAGCTASSSQPVGSDRDAHGCIPSAGYSWCERTRQCERPWELAKEHGFANTQAAFDGFCLND